MKKQVFFFLQSKVATNFYLSLIFIPENLTPQGIKSIIGTETYYKKRDLNFTQAWNLKRLNFFTTVNLVQHISAFLKENNVACMDSLSHHLESFLSQIQWLFFASGLLYPDRIGDLRWSDNLGSKDSMIPAASPVWWNLWPPETNQWKFWRYHSLWKRPFLYIYSKTIFAFFKII